MLSGHRHSSLDGDISIRSSFTSDTSRSSGRISSDSTRSLSPDGTQCREVKGLNWRLARHTVGVLLLLATVLLWTVSNFLASTIFADNSYSKPYFVTYINSSFFAVLLVFTVVKRYWSDKSFSLQPSTSRSQSTAYVPVSELDETPNAKANPDDFRAAGQLHGSGLVVDDSMISTDSRLSTEPDGLGVRATAWLGLEFCLLWFLANYFVAACLEFTTVASSTILTSTSSIWTLVLGAWLKVETFTLKKLLGSLMSLAGVVLISSVDLTANNDTNRGEFPHKSHKELAIGDILAIASAILYGIYTTLMKKRIDDERQVDMILFFGFVGLFNLVTLLPGLAFVHLTGIETFELPPTRRITTIVLINSATSLVSDFCWAYSMLLTSPLVVTVGLSLTIPLSLLGQMLVNRQTSGLMYWIGAAIVFVSFVFINHESKQKGSEGDDHSRSPRRAGIWKFARRIWDKTRG